MYVGDAGDVHPCVEDVNILFHSYIQNAYIIRLNRDFFHRDSVVRFFRNTLKVVFFIVGLTLSRIAIAARLGGELTSET